MLIYGRVYLITNLINGKQYVGKTKQGIKTRFVKHCSDAKNNRGFCMPIIKAIQKHGKENFKIEEIDVAYNKNELKLLEGVYISWFNTLVPNGYNLTSVINGKYKVSEETKTKMKIAQNCPERLKLSSERGIKSRGKTRIDSKSKYCGVYIQNKKYLSGITFNQKNIYLGTYNIESDAAKAYDIAAIKYFGDSTVLNFPELREDYINNKIIVNKNNKQTYSKSGIKGIHFNKKINQWIVISFDKNLNKNKSKWFKKLEDAIKFKESL